MDLMQRMGIGTRMSFAQMKEAIDDGFTTVYWHVLENNAGANATSMKFRSIVQGKDTMFTEQLREIDRAIVQQFGHVNGAGLHCRSAHPV